MSLSRRPRQVSPGNLHSGGTIGLNYNYLLYFDRDHLWNALTGLVKICDPIEPPPTTIHFPDRDLKLPIATDFGEKNEYPYDKPELRFAISMLFDEDEVILDYLSSINHDWLHRAPPGDGGIEQVVIGFIYLTVYTDLSKHYAFKKPTDMVLFRFGTTGTRMSLLFSESESIRRTFAGLLANYHGVSGIFDREIDYGQLFWFKGKQVQMDVISVYMLPEDIEEMLKRGW
jgi:hypothetical protein